MFWQWFIFGTGQRATSCTVFSDLFLARGRRQRVVLYFVLWYFAYTAMPACWSLHVLGKKLDSGFLSTYGVFAWLAKANLRLEGQYARPNTSPKRWRAEHHVLFCCMRMSLCCYALFWSQLQFSPVWWSGVCCYWCQCCTAHTSTSIAHLSKCHTIGSPHTKTSTTTGILPKQLWKISSAF